MGEVKQEIGGAGAAVMVGSSLIAVFGAMWAFGYLIESDLIRWAMRLPYGLGLPVYVCSVLLLCGSGGFIPLTIGAGIASGIEARRAATTGAVEDESPVPQGDAQ